MKFRPVGDFRDFPKAPPPAIGGPNRPLIAKDAMNGAQLYLAWRYLLRF